MKKIIERGCVFCTHMHLNECPNAFTEVAKHCGLYRHDTIEVERPDPVPQEAADATEE